MKHAKAGENALFGEDREQLWNVCKTLREKMVVSSMWHGMRPGEFVRMNKSWVLWQTGKIQIFGTKTKDALRTIPIINDFLRGTLERFFGEYPSMKDAKISGRNTVNNILSRVADRTDIKKHVHAQGMRATCALMLAEKGLNAVELCHFMGWSDIVSAKPYLRLAGKLATDKVNELRKKGVSFI